MIHHFYLLSLLAATSYGQRTFDAAPQNPPAMYNPPNFSRLPNNNLLPSDNGSPNVAPINGLLPQELPNDQIPPIPNETEFEPKPLDPNNDNVPDSSRDAICKMRFGYFKIDNRCDSYVECRDYRAAERLCPDGTHFDVDMRWPEYPCGYPMDVPCEGQDIVQPAKPTANCPHQFGFYPVVDVAVNRRDRCSRYLMCAEGQARLMDCPFGLAFNPTIGRCDWPELVPTCKDFLGFSCPAPPLGKEEQGLVRNYRYSEGECYYFWSCQDGRARVLSCDYGLAFDPSMGRCVNEDLSPCKDRKERRMETSRKF